MYSNKRRLLNRQGNAFGIRKAKIPLERGKKPTPPKPKVYVEPEVTTVIQPKIEKGEINLKAGESAILTSTFSDPDNLRIVNLEGEYSKEFLSPEKTKITALEDISGQVQLRLPLETRCCDLQVEYLLKSGIFRLNKSLSEDLIDLKITSFLLDGEEQLKGGINWEVLNMYFETPDNKICKYDYGEMFNKAFSGTRISSCLDPNFVHYGTELIQKFTWPENMKWLITLSDDTKIDSDQLEDVTVDECSSKIIEWDDIKGNWESLWVKIDDNKVDNVIKGTWCEVIEKLIDKDWDCFDTGIIYPSEKSFTFCLKQGSQEYLFTNCVS